jgi:parallel beta-helix repeat protein
MRKTTFLITTVAIASALAFAVKAYAETIVVPAAFKTVQQAVDNAKPNDTVIVKAGQYDENVVITKPITLMAAEGAASPVISAADRNKPVIKITETSGVYVSGITVTGSADAGVLLSNAHNSTLRNITATKNLSGIVLSRSNNNTVIDSVAEFNEIYGIYLEYSNANRVENNTASNNSDKGFFISGSDGNVITGNNANLNTWNGMTIWSSDNNVITHNMTLRNTFGIVESDSKGNDLSDNTTLPNFYIIYPILLVYIGIIFYLAEKNIARLIYSKATI